MGSKKEIKISESNHLPKIFEDELQKEIGFLLKSGKNRPFRKFKAILMTEKGITASEMVIRDRL